MVTILPLLGSSAQTHDIRSPAEASPKLFFPGHERTARADDEETVHHSLASQLVKGGQDDGSFSSSHNRKVGRVRNRKQMPYWRPLMRQELPNEPGNPQLFRWSREDVPNRSNSFGQLLRGAPCPLKNPPSIVVELVLQALGLEILTDILKQIAQSLRTSHFIARIIRSQVTIQACFAVRPVNAPKNGAASLGGHDQRIAVNGDGDHERARLMVHAFSSSPTRLL